MLCATALAVAPGGVRDMSIKKLAIGLAVLIVVLGAGALGAEFAAQAWMTQQVDAMLAQPAVTKASHGAVRYSFWRRHLEIDDLVVETNVPELRSGRAEHIEIDGVSPFIAAGDDLVVPAMTARALEVTGDTLHQSFGSLSLREVRLAGGLAFDTTLPREQLVASILDRLAVQRIEARDVRQSMVVQGGEVAFAGLAAEDLSKGRIASITGTKMVARTAIQTRPGATMRTEVATLRLAGIDLLAWRRAFDPAALAGRSPAASAKELSLDRLDATGVTGTFAEGGGGKVTIAHLGVDKLARGSVGGLELDDLVYAAPQGSFRLRALRLDGFAYALRDGPVAIPQLFISRLSLDDIAFGAKAGAEISVKQMLVTMAGSLGKATGMAFKVATITIPATAAPPLRLVGYNELVMDYEAQSSYDAAQGSVMSTQHLTAHDAGELTLSLRMSNYPAVFDARDFLSLLTRLSEARLDRFELRYDDASLIDRVIKFDAMRTQRSAEAVREGFIAQVEAQRASHAEKPAMSASLDAIIAFLRQPASLTLTLAPPQPLTFGTLTGLSKRDPDAVFETLGVSVH